MSETALTKKIKQACVAFRPEMPTKMRTIRYAYEVKSPESGIIDVVRFEDYISNNKSYCKRFVSNYLSELDKIILRDGVGECKIKGEQYPNKNCSGCVWYSHVYELDMMTTCFEVKISLQTLVLNFNNIDYIESLGVPKSTVIKCNPDSKTDKAAKAAGYITKPIMTPLQEALLNAKTSLIKNANNESISEER